VARFPEGMSNEVNRRPGWTWEAAGVARPMGGRAYAGAEEAGARHPVAPKPLPDGTLRSSPPESSATTSARTGNVHQILRMNRSTPRAESPVPPRGTWEQETCRIGTTPYPYERTGPPRGGIPGFGSRIKRSPRRAPLTRDRESTGARLPGVVMRFSGARTRSRRPRTASSRGRVPPRPRSRPSSP